MKLGLWFHIALGAALTFACGDGSKGGGSGGSSGSAGSAGSAGSSGSSGSGGTTAGVACGPSETCPSGQACCVSIASSTTSCNATCDGNTSAFRCDGPEDCDGNACCGTVAEGFACSSTNGCSSGVERCHGVEDCSSGTQCVPVSIGDISIDSCQP